MLQMTLHLGVENAANVILVNILGSRGACPCLLCLGSQSAPSVVALMPAFGVAFLEHLYWRKATWWKGLAGSW